MEKTKLEKELESYCKEAVKTYRGDFTDLVFASFELMDNSDEESEDGERYFILTVDGGLNGCGSILFYMEDIVKLIKKLMLRFGSVWLIDWKNDCPDDLFRLRLGLRLI